MAWCYGLIVVGLLAPPIILKLFGIILPVGFYIAILLILTIAFYAYAFGNLWLAIPFAVLGLVYLAFRALTGIVAFMARFPQGVIGTLAYAVSAVTFAIDYYNLCSCLGGSC